MGFHVRIATPASPPPPAQRKTKKLDPVLANIHQSSLLLVQHQSASIQPSSQSVHQSLPVTRLAQDHKIVRVSHHPWFEFAAFVHLPVELVQIGVGQKR